MKTRAIQFITITFAGWTAMAVDPAPPPTASELLAKYSQALHSTRRFVSTSESSCLLNCRVPSWGIEVHNARFFDRSEERIDSRGHLYEKSLHWGYESANEQHLTETNPRYNLRVVGDGFVYSDSKKLGQTRHKGHVTYQVKGFSESEKYKATSGYYNGDSVLGRCFSEYEKYRATSSYYNGDTLLGHFLGYMSAWRRLDGVLRSARSISVRPKPETIKGAVCYVLEADTEYGRFVLWLDSEHGYHPARVRASVRVGDDIGVPGNPSVITSAEAITRDYRMDNVRFEKVGDVWVPMEADAKRLVVLVNEHGFCEERNHYKRTKIVLNPDHDALGSFADPMKNPAMDPELVNGSIVFLGSGQKNTWQDGVVLDPEGKVVLDLRPKNPNITKPAPAGKK
jgi:hypothetical protein